MFGLYRRLRPVFERLLTSCFSSDFSGKVLFKMDLWIMKALSKLGRIVSERIVEYDWILAALRSGSGRVLDVGSGRSFFPCELLGTGFDVYSLDVKPPRLKNSIVGYVRADVGCTPFPDEVFDAVTAVSTLEHIGMGVEGEPMYRDGDIKAVAELRRVLKNGGLMLITVPYSRRFYLSWQTFYDEARLNRLTDGFNALRKTYYISRRSKWLISLKEEAEFQPVDPEKSATAIVCLSLKKL